MADVGAARSNEREADDSDSDIQIDDNEVVVCRSTFPNGVRDFVLHRRTDEHALRVLNPLELLGTNMAVRVLQGAGRLSAENAAQFSLSRLLVQCLEYRGNTRHLIVEEWDDGDLRGERLFEGNRTEFARDCSVQQARRYQLVMSGAEAPLLPGEHLYWGAFSTLPGVQDVFEDSDLGDLAIKLLARIEGDGNGNATIDIHWLRTLIKQAWTDHFSDFELDVSKRARRDLFKKLMSVAVRQASTLMRQIAYALTLQKLAPRLRENFQLTEREEKLFEIRYGSFRPLGNINIGFLFGDGDLHTELLNNLGNSLVSEKSETEVQKAEDDLYRHVQLLSEVRDLRCDVRAEQRRTTRLSKARALPGPRIQAEGQEDVSAPRPDDNMISTETQAELKRLLPRLKERDRIRVKAIIQSGGDKRAAAELLNVEPEVFMRRYRQTTQKNVKAAAKLLQKQEDKQKPNG
jgi:hypothetical protein